MTTRSGPDAGGGRPDPGLAAIMSERRRLINLATLITPNLPEAEALAGETIPDLDTMKHAAAALLTIGCHAVLLTGGHMKGDVLTDVLATAHGVELFESRRIPTTSTHGTGCTIASAIATGLAQGMELRRAVLRARAYVRRAIETAPGYGHGHGPLNHGHTVAPDAAPAAGE